MITVYGASDDLVEIEGTICEEIGCYDHDVEIEFTDGTKAIFHYGKPEGAIWECKILAYGDECNDIVRCFDEDAEIYSDILYLGDSARIKTIRKYRVDERGGE